MTYQVCFLDENLTNCVDPKVYTTREEAEKACKLMKLFCECAWVMTSEQLSQICVIDI